MESYENFKSRNAAFGNYNIPTCHEKEMQKCYAIALQVEKTYNEKFSKTDEPQIGDIVEFADDYHVYKHAKITEDLYGDGKLCICENGGSWTDGESFSTSGGAFVRKDKSLLQYAGEDFNVVWTWGCYGVGAHQGIYFPLKVRKWIIPYEPKNVKRSIINFKKNDDGEIISVAIENSDSCMYSVMGFNSMAAFKAWAEYVGYEYHMENERGYSHQKVLQKCWTETVPKPENGKPIKVLANGRIHDGLVVTEEFSVTQWWGNIYRPHAAYGTPEYKKECDEELMLHRKYAQNPMGV